MVYIFPALMLVRVLHVGGDLSDDEHGSKSWRGARDSHMVGDDCLDDNSCHDRRRSGTSREHLLSPTSPGWGAMTMEGDEGNGSGSKKTSIPDGENMWAAVAKTVRVMFTRAEHRGCALMFTWGIGSGILGVVVTVMKQARGS